MKIAFISHPWAAISEGGATGIFSCQVASRLKESDEVLIYGQIGNCGNAPGISFRHFSISLDKRINGFLKKVYKLPFVSRPKLPLFANQITYLFFGIKVAIQLRKDKPDIVHIHDLSQLPPLIRLLNPSIKIVLHMHIEWLSQFDIKTVRKRLKSVDLILSCSNYVNEKTKARFPDLASNCKVIHNGVDINSFKPIPGSKGKQKKKRILFVGRISPEKGIHHLLHAFKLVQIKYPDVVLDIVGPDGMLSYSHLAGIIDNKYVDNLQSFYGRESYLKQIQSSIDEELGKKIIFYGFVKRDPIIKIYNSADLLVNPSLYETFGMSLIEGMAMKLPVVATSIGGMTEIVVNNQNGLLIPPENPEALAEAILSLLLDKKKAEQLGINGLKIVEEKFSWDKITLQLHKYYSDLME